MSATTKIIIKFEKTIMSPEFFQTLDKCFAEHNFKPAEKAMFMPLDPAGARELKWSDVGKHFRQGDIIKIGYSLSPQFNIGVSISYHYNYCDRISLTASVKGFRWSYSEEEKDKAYKLEALCLTLHEKLNAYDTVAKANYHEEPWFRFSKEEWKPLGELPVEKN